MKIEASPGHTKALRHLSEGLQGTTDFVSPTLWLSA
jgi:hypothetical protein